jgi:hypothetical protein
VVHCAQGTFVQLNSVGTGVGRGWKPYQGTTFQIAAVAPGAGENGCCALSAEVVYGGIKSVWGSPQHGCTSCESCAIWHKPTATGWHTVACRPPGGSTRGSPDLTARLGLQCWVDMCKHMGTSTSSTDISCVQAYVPEDSTTADAAEQSGARCLSAVLVHCEVLGGGSACDQPH